LVDEIDRAIRGEAAILNHGFQVFRAGDTIGDCEVNR